MTVRLQTADFDVSQEQRAMCASHDVGAVVAFIGLVRTYNAGLNVEAMTLEHHPEMAQKALEDIEHEARGRWPILDCLIVHRFGRLLPGDQIVLVIVTSAHREDAFDAASFLMDYLKTRAPFWKLEESDKEERWVEARTKDDERVARWKNGR